MGELVGRRLPDADNGWGEGEFPSQDGDYMKVHGTYHCVCPHGGLVCLAKWTVTEHEDGTITAEPSINVLGPEENKWHGWLRKGVFVDA